MMGMEFQDKIFEHYVMSTGNPDSNEFYIEINADEFILLLKSASSARSLSLRLQKKDTPHLQIFTKHQVGKRNAFALHIASVVFTIF